MTHIKKKVTANDNPLSADELRKTDAYWRACNYIAAGMIYLQDNPLLREPLENDHIKKTSARSLGGESRAVIHVHTHEPAHQQV